PANEQGPPRENADDPAQLAPPLRTMTKRIHKPRFRRLAADDGQSIVEFTLVMPFLVFLLVGICQFGLAFHDYLSVTDAARVGARKAAVSRAAAGGPCQAA